VNTARAGTIALEPLLREMPSIGAVMQTMLGRERSHPYACATQTLIEEYAIELPEGLKVAFLPKSVDEEGAGISYSASYRVDGAKIRVVRRLDNRVQGNVCPPSRFNELQPFAQAVLVDLKTQLVVEPR
jgi:hypothetical protein